MAENLIIIESGGKINTLKKILGPTWDVTACGGHIRDMPRNEMGFNLETLEINYEISEKGQRALNSLRPKVKAAKRIVLAMDKDREGEAIADGLKECLELKDSDYERCTYHAVTKEQVLKALSEPRKIDYDMVRAQNYRRMIDRLVGYDSTAAVQIKTGIWSVVGRVQTPALNMVVARDLEIESFVSTTHYSVRLKTKDQWSCSLDTKISGLEDDNGYWLAKAKANEVASKIKSIKVVNLSKTQTKTPPPNAFKTTTMQQTGINKLGITGKEVMDLAGVLYNEGFITYLRTDDESMSDEGYDSLCQYVNQVRKDLTLNSSKRDPKGKKAANIQEAHECIRPTDFMQDKLTVSNTLTEKHIALYNLIYQRALASQLDDAVIAGIKLTLEGDLDGKKYTFTASSSEVSYLGWRKLTAKDDSVEDEDDDDLKEGQDGKIPLLEKGKLVQVESGEILTKKTKPPANFTEIKLIGEMERVGIGRPSTYQAIVTKLNKEGHGYVKDAKKNKRNIIVSTKNGRDLIKSIEGTLGDGVLNTHYTKEMESSLDAVAGGMANPEAIMFEFIKRLKDENEMLMSNPMHKCTMPDCNSSMIQGRSKKTKKLFWRCLRQECKNIVNDEDGAPGASFEAKRALKIKEFSNADGTPKYPCPECASALIEIEGKWGSFWPCSKQNNASCTYKAKDDCGKPMSVEKEKALNDERAVKEAEAITRSTAEDGKTPLWECSECKGMVVQRESKSGNWWYACANKDCGTRYWGEKDDKAIPDLSAPIKDK